MRKGIKILVFSFIFFFLFALFQLNSVSLLTGTGAIDDDYEIKNTEVYQELYKIYEDYMAAMKLQMEEIGQEYIEEYIEAKKAELEAQREQDDTEVVEEEQAQEPEISVTAKITVHSINLSYVFAYLSMTDESALAQKKYDVRAQEETVIAMYEAINVIVVNECEDKCFIYNEVLSPEEMAEHFFERKTEQERFLYYYDGYYSFIGEMASIEEYYLGDYFIEESPEEVSVMPLYYQYAQPWGTMAYGTSNIKNCGCGPTCIAMVVSYLKDKAIFPNDVVAFTGNRYYTIGGSAWSIFPACASYYGVRCRSVGKNTQAVIRALSEGNPVIVSMGPGTFTKSGHFIVLRSIDANGKVYVNDPNDNGNKNFYNRAFSLNHILAESKNFWVFSKEGKDKEWN